MQRLGGVLIAILAVFVAIGVVYTLNHHDAVPNAGQTQQSSRHTTSGGNGGSTPAPSSKVTRQAKVVAFLGDDWVAGTGASKAANRATTLLCTRLGVRERNFGTDRSGYVVGAGFGSRVAAVAAADPDVVVVIGGRNDAVQHAGGTADAARSLFAKLRAALPGATLIAVAPMWGDSDAPRALTSLRTVVERAVRAAGGTYLDIADPIRGHPDRMADAADPDDAGYRAIAAAIEPKLAPLL